MKIAHEKNVGKAIKTKKKCDHVKNVRKKYAVKA